ncbi:MAG: hypothetical protein WC584_03805 [Candidatus Pacearchaeota archaeon]
MNFQFYLEKLMASYVFGDFMKENKDAYPCGGFFIIDKVSYDNKQHLDYYVPSLKKIFSFKLEDEIQLIPVEMIDPRIPGKIKSNYNFDFNDIEEMIKEEMVKQKIDKTLQKIILSLQELENKDYLIGTVFVSGLGMIKINIDISEMKIIVFEKKSFFDLVRKT